MTIICHGCSFTRYRWACWPNFVSWFVDSEVKNFGHIGSANETIARKVIDSTKENPEHLYVMWSGANRYETWFENNIIRTGGHPDIDKHKYYVKHFSNDEQNLYRTLEKILLVQLYLENKNIPYTMMVWKGDIISNNFKIYDDIDWSKFKFYKKDKGLWEFGHELYSEYYIDGDLHPPPIAHYHWTKDIIFESDLKCPDNEYKKIKQFKYIS